VLDWDLLADGIARAFGGVPARAFDSTPFAQAQALR